MRWLFRTVKRKPRVVNIPEYYTKGAEKKIRLEGIPGFGPLAAKIIEDRRTYLGYDRLYTLWQATQEVVPYSIVIEVGAWRGGSAKFIHDSLRVHGKHNQMYVCDTFKGHAAVDPTVDGLHRVGDGFSNVTEADVRGYLSTCSNMTIMAGDIMTTAKDIPATNIGLLHLDCDVYPPTKFCLETFGRYRFVRGSVIVVDDYGFTTCKGVKKAVDEYFDGRHNYRLFHLTTGQMVAICLV